MKVELFMNNPTDNFFSPGNKNTLYDDAAWLGGKNFIHPSTADSIITSKGKRIGTFSSTVQTIAKYSLREEDFGSVVLNESTSKVYKLDHEATEAAKLFLSGNNLKSISKYLDVTEDALEEVYNLFQVVGTNES